MTLGAQAGGFGIRPGLKKFSRGGRRRRQVQPALQEWVGVAGRPVGQGVVQIGTVPTASRHPVLRLDIGQAGGRGGRPGIGHGRQRQLFPGAVRSDFCREIREPLGPERLHDIG